MAEENQEQMEQEEKLPMPACFDDQRQWDDYQLLYRLSMGRGRINYCLDCLPEHRRRMNWEGKCAHPETVFIESFDGPVGINGTVWALWMSAISGKRGNVIAHPTRAIRDKFIEDSIAENPNRQKVEEIRELRKQKRKQKRKAKAHE